MKRYLVLSLSLSLVMLGTFASGQTGADQNKMRGENNVKASSSVDLEATQETMALEIIVEEIEDAGFELDVEEGFEEEWEEEIWAGTDEDELDALLIDPEDADMLVVTELPEPEEVVEENIEAFWENPEDVIEEAETAEEAVGEEWGGDLWENYHEEYEVAFGADWQHDLWEETIAEDEVDPYEEAAEQYDESWEEVLEEIELDEMEDTYEHEDLDMLEELFYLG